MSTNDEIVLNYHLMHPGEDSRPGDPNAAYFLAGTALFFASREWRRRCHLHNPKRDSSVGVLMVGPMLEIGVQVLRFVPLTLFAVR